VGAVVGGFVVDDDGEAGEEGEDAEEVEDGVDVGAGGLLASGVGGLEDEDSLRDEKQPSTIEELWLGKGCVSLWCHVGRMCMGGGKW